jgi:hypothetical protein
MQQQKQRYKETFLEDEELHYQIGLKHNDTKSIAFTTKVIHHTTLQQYNPSL